LANINKCREGGGFSLSRCVGNRISVTLVKVVVMTVENSEHQTSANNRISLTITASPELDFSLKARMM
jgi:hypothetical protein